jgi:hypothetical protein
VRNVALHDRTVNTQLATAAGFQPLSQIALDSLKQGILLQWFGLRTFHIMPDAIILGQNW